MSINFAPQLKPFDIGERPKGVGNLPSGIGGSSMPLSKADLNGIISHTPKRHARSTGVVSKTGLEAIDKASVKNTDEEQHRQIEDHAKQLVSQTFFGAMLKQMRESPFKSELFDGGKGGQAYNSLFDQRLVDQMSRGAGKKLVHSLVKKLERAKATKAYAEQGAGTASSSPLASITTGVAANRAAALPASTSADNHSNRDTQQHVAPARRA